MGFSLTGTHVIFFIASVIAAVTVSGIFMAATNNISTSLSDRGKRIQEQLDTEFRIINDPQNIPEVSGYYRFYLKNIGSNTLQTTNQTFQVFIDGDLVAITNYNFSDDTTAPNEVTTIHISNSEISQGDHTLRVVGPQAIDDTFEFIIP